MNRKMSLGSMVCLLIIAVLLSISSGDAIAAGDQIELRLATFCPPPPAPGDIVSTGVTWFASELEKRTKGKAKVKVFWSQTLAKQVELPRAVKNGAADMATVVGNFHPEMFPYSFGLSQPCFVTAGLDLGGWIKPYRAFSREFAPEAQSFAKQNQKVIAFWEFDQMNIISTKPIKSFADAKGMKIRNVGEYLPQMFRAVGFSSISIPPTEVYDALQKGMMEGAQATADTALKYRWYETCKYYTETPVFGTTLNYFLSINLDTWNKLPADVKDTMVKMGEELTDMFPGFSRDTRDLFKKAFLANGGTFVKFSEAQQKEWKAKVAKDAMEMYIKKTEAKGVSNVREAVDRLGKLIDFKL